MSVYQLYTNIPNYSPPKSAVVSVITDKDQIRVSIKINRNGYKNNKLLTIFIYLMDTKDEIVE